MSVENDVWSLEFGLTASETTCVHSWPVSDVLCVMCDCEKDQREGWWSVLKIFRCRGLLPLISVTSELGRNPKCYCLVVPERKQLEFGSTSSFLSISSYLLSVRFQFVDSTATFRARHRTLNATCRMQKSCGVSAAATIRRVRWISATDEHLSEWCTAAEKSRESITDMSNCREQVSGKPDASTAPQLPANWTSDQSPE